ncbi:DUF334 domain-containing protein [Staphylococcus saprophyticus]|nr:DUF334 domain-containing protein [Staphylococcus saprophyticus]MDW4172267.1 DUF334 domain-containing protein [Staphylococcus saprophyticus]
MDELNPENKKILEKLDQIEKQLNQSGTTSQTTPDNLNTIEEVLKQQDLLMRNLSEIKRNEKEREKNHKALLENIKASTSNFNQATKNTEDKFISVARSYLRKIDTDNQEQDFKQAFDEKFKDIDKQASDLFEHYKKHNEQARKETNEYKKTITERLDKNDTIVENLNKSLDIMTKAVVSLFFVVAIIALVSLVTGPISNFFGLSQGYDFINHEIATKESTWRYLWGVLYVLPYVFFGFLIYGVLKAFNAIRWK